MRIADPEVEALAKEISQLTGESTTEVIRRSLLQRLARLRRGRTTAGRAKRVRDFLANEVWPRIPDEQLGNPPGRAEREGILGWSEEGV